MVGITVASFLLGYIFGALIKIGKESDDDP